MPSHNLPRQSTRFFGRENDISEIVKRLSDPYCRLLTLVGPGGIGKTRLAIEVGNRTEFDEGVYFVPLQAIAARDDIVTAIIDVLSLQLDSGDSPLNQLLDYLESKHLLFILDNFEHLIDGAHQITALLDGTHKVKFLVTSRERLNLKAEHVWTMHGLDSQTVDDISTTQPSAIQLFDERATRVSSTFDFEYERDAVIEICQLVDGLPLAIELAATWVRAMTCEKIVSEIQQNIDFLATDQPDIPDRHRSLSAVFDYSWGLLSANEQAVLSKLSVFRGGFALDAAARVTGASLSILASLIDKSLIQLRSDGRYDMHELVRQYAEAKLITAGEHETILDLHADFYSRFMAAQSAPIRDHRQGEALDAIARDFENIRSAWLYATQHVQVDAISRMVETLDIYGYMRGRDYEVTILNEYTVDVWEQSRFSVSAVDMARMRLYRDISGQDRRTLSNSTEQLQQLYDDTQHTLELARQLDDRNLMGLSLSFLNSVEKQRGNLQQATTYLEQAYSAFETVGDLYYMATSNQILMNTYRHFGQVLPEGHHATLHGAFELARRCGAPSAVAVALIALGEERFSVDGDAASARALFEEALELSQAAGFYKRTGQAFFELGMLALYEMKIDEAQSIADRLMDMGQRYHISVVIGSAKLLLAHLSAWNGNYAAGKRYSEEGHRHVVSGGYFNAEWKPELLMAACGLGDDALLGDQLHHFLRFAVSNPNSDGWTKCLICVGAAFYIANQEQVERAVSLVGRAATFPKLPERWWLNEWPLLQNACVKWEAELGKEPYQAAWEYGATLDLDTVLRELASELEVEIINPPQVHPQPLIEALSERELEVLALVADGSSNREIAERLFITVGTVKRHVSNIFGKLNTTNRTQTVARARDLGLID